MMNEDTGDKKNSFFSMVTGKKDGIFAAEKDSLDTLSGDISDGDCIESSERLVDEKVAHDVSFSADDPLLTESPLPVDGSDMPHDARRVLVHLMRQGVVISSQKPQLFDSVCRYEVLLRRHLAEVYLQLVLDQKSGVAFVATSTSEHGDDEVASNDDDGTEEFATLISKRTLSLYDTLILLVLRKHYQDRESAGEQKITIDIERLESYLIPFLPITDHASKDRKKLLTRVKEMIRRRVLSTIRGYEDRYEITPIIRYVVSARFLESMLAVYADLASGLSDEHTDINHNTEKI